MTVGPRLHSGFMHSESIGHVLLTLSQDGDCEKGGSVLLVRA